MKTLLFPSLLWGALAAPAAAFAGDEPQKLEPVLVTATRSLQAQNRLPAALAVITREDIEASGAAHVVDVLRGIGGAQITDFYGDGSRAQVDLRGFGDGAHSTTLILVDGRRLNNPDIAPPDLNSISLKDVERIEVIRGSAGALYGDQAVGGVINIITRKPESLVLDADLGGSSYGGERARASVAQRLGNASYRLSAEGRGSDNYREHNRLEYKNALGRAGYDYSSGSVFAELGYVQEDLETPGALFANEVQQNRRQASANFRGDFSDTTTALQRLNWLQALGDNWNLETDLTHRKSNGTFRLSFAAFPSTNDSMQNRNVWSLNPRLAGGFALPAGQALLTLGVDAQLAEYQLRSVFGTQANDQRLRDIYAQAVLPLWRTLEATVGARSARVENKVLDGFTFVTPTRFHDTRNSTELGLALRPLDGLRLFARYDGNFRFAKVDEFTNAGAPFGSNQNALKTQTGDSFELGGEWKVGAVELRSTLYRLEQDNEITFDPASFTNINLNRTRRDGVIVETGWQALDVLKLSASAQQLNAKVSGGTFAGKQIPLVARSTGRLAAVLKLPFHLNAYLETLGTGRRAFAGDFDNSLGKLPGFGVTNLALNGEWNRFRIGARINNLFGRQYAEYGAASFDSTFTERESFFPSPERNFWLNLGYTL